MCEYILKENEKIISATTEYAARRIRKALKYSKILRLVPHKEVTSVYFIVERRSLSEISSFADVFERGNLKTSDFAFVEDETVYRKRRERTSLDEVQGKLF